MKERKTREELLAELEEAKRIFEGMKGLKLEERRRLSKEGKAGTQEFSRVCGSENAWELAAEELGKILEGAAG